MSQSWNPDPKFASLKLIEECLIGFGFEEDCAREITSPLHQVHSFRSKLKGHASGSEAVSIKRQVLAEHAYIDNISILCAKHLMNRFDKFATRLRTLSDDACRTCRTVSRWHSEGPRLCEDNFSSCRRESAHRARPSFLDPT